MDFNNLSSAQGHLRINTHGKLGELHRSSLQVLLMFTCLWLQVEQGRAAAAAEGFVQEKPGTPEPAGRHQPDSRGQVPADESACRLHPTAVCV